MSISCILMIPHALFSIYFMYTHVAMGCMYCVWFNTQNILGDSLCVFIIYVLGRRVFRAKNLALRLRLVPIVLDYIPIYLFIYATPFSCCTHNALALCTTQLEHVYMYRLTRTRSFIYTPHKCVCVCIVWHSTCVQPSAVLISTMVQWGPRLLTSHTVVNAYPCIHIILRI